MAGKAEPTERQSAGAAAGSDDELNQQLHAIIDDLQRAGLQPNHPEEDEPVERDDHAAINGCWSIVKVPSKD